MASEQSNKRFAAQGAWETPGRKGAGAKEQPPRRKNGKWYEESILHSQMAHLLASDFKKKIKNEPVYFRELGSRAKAQKPYKNCAFVLVADQNDGSLRNAHEDMAISLADFCRLSANIDEVKKSGYDTGKLDSTLIESFEAYLGEPPGQTAIEKAIEKEWIVLPDKLEQIVKEKEDGKKKNNSSKKRSASEASQASESTSAPPRHNDGADNAHGNSLVNTSGTEIFTCVGLLSGRVDDRWKGCPIQTLACFDYCRGAFRDRECLLQKMGGNDSSGDDDGSTWSRVDGGFQCIKCKSRNKNIRSGRYPFLFEMQSAAQAQTSPLPENEEAISRILLLYQYHGQQVCDDPELIQLMGLLRQRKVMEVDLNDGNKIFSCPGYMYRRQLLEDKEDASREIAYGHCQLVNVVKQRVDNINLCGPCASKKEQHHRSLRHAEENFDQMTACDSRTKFTALYPTLMTTRVANLNRGRKTRRAQIERATATIEKDRDVILKLKADDDDGEC